MNLVKKFFPLKLEIRQTCPITIFIPYCTGRVLPNEYNQARKRDAKYIMNKKEKKSLFENNMIMKIQKNLPISYENY